MINDILRLDSRIDKRTSLQVRLGRDIQVFFDSGAPVQLNSRKARALIAIVALSAHQRSTRADVAAMLWSKLNRIDGLARLRDLLYHLQKEFSSAGLRALRLDREKIELNSDVVSLNTKCDCSGDLLNPVPASDYLVDLEGIDPAFDRWIAYTRAERLQAHVPPNAENAKSSSKRITASNRLRDKPALLVTRIEAFGSTVASEFASILTHEIASSLVRVRWIDVIVSSLDGSLISPQDTREFPKANYSLAGNVQKRELGWQLSLILMDLEDDCTVVWAATFEQSVDPKFPPSGWFARMVTARLDNELLIIEANRKMLLPVEKKRTDAYRLVLQGVSAIYRLDREQFMGAGYALEQAVAMDRNSAMAHSWLAYWHIFLVGQGWTINPAQSLTKASNTASRAITLDPQDARAFTIGGHVKAFLGRQIGEAITLHDIALQLNPALGLAWHLSGVTYAYAGLQDEALRRILYSRELAFGDPHGFFSEAALGIVHLLLHNHKEAIAVGRRVTEQHPQFTSAYKSYLSALGHSGETAESRAVLNRLHVIEPQFSLRWFRASAPYQKTSDLEHYMAGLRLAGVT